MKNIIASLPSKSGRYSYCLEINADYLIRKWKRGKEGGEKRIALERMCSETSCTTSRPNHSNANLTAGIIITLLGVVFFCSTVQQKIPLLSLLVGAIGIWLLVKTLINFKRETWTVFHEENGDLFAHVIHRGCDDDDREKFVQIFTELVDKKRNQQIK